jgi:hypothetical protein
MCCGSGYKRNFSKAFVSANEAPVQGASKKVSKRVRGLKTYYIKAPKKKGKAEAVKEAVIEPVKMPEKDLTPVE